MGQITQENSYVDWRVYTECLDLIDNPERPKYMHFDKDIMHNGDGLLFEVQQELRTKLKEMDSERPTCMWVCFDKPVIYQDFGEIVVNFHNSESICFDALHDHNEAIAFIDCVHAIDEIKVPKSLVKRKDISNCRIRLRFTMCLYKDDKFIYNSDIDMYSKYFEQVCELLKSKIEQKLKELA